jgi:DNA-binding response OmpR family regulator
MANILLLEPDGALAATYSQALVHAGHAVVHVTTAQAAIQAADHTIPDVVLLELQLAAHDGIEFLYELRSYAEWQAIPVLIVTNTPLSALVPVRKALVEDLGVVECLYKPRVTLQQLLGHVKEAIK